MGIQKLFVKYRECMTRFVIQKGVFLILLPGGESLHSRGLARVIHQLDGRHKFMNKAVLCSDVSVFDPTVYEECYGKKNRNKNKGSEKLRFPEEQENKQQYCYADNKVRMVPNNCEGT